MEMKRSIVLATPAFLSVLDVAKAAEDRNFDRIWTTENPGRDALIRALTIGLHTKRIGVATGITYAFTRAPLAMAATASDIAVATNNRFEIGIGVGTQGMRSRWYGIEDFDHPASRLEEYVQVMRTAWEAEKKFKHEGTYFKGNYPDLDGARTPVPIWGSGVNEIMLKLSARSCDGVATHPLVANLNYLDKVALPAMNEGKAAHNRGLQIAVWRITSIDKDGDVARERAKKNLAFYFSTPSYAAAANESGWGEVAEQVKATFLEKGADWETISQLIPVEMVNDFAIAGTPAEVQEQYGKLEIEYANRGVTEIVFQTVGSGDNEEETISNLNNIVETFGR
jgi:alkanesulfonate monooxygenase SsuD/methylene tetrahydromethanopterin reductase-like flavin-dependent oxidoreductase (luciferase family)